MTRLATASKPAASWARLAACSSRTLEKLMSDRVSDGQAKAGQPAVVPEPLLGILQSVQVGVGLPKAFFRLELERYRIRLPLVGCGGVHGVAELHVERGGREWSG